MMLAAIGRSFGRAARDGARAAALGLGRRIAHRAAEGRGPVAWLSTRSDSESAPPGSIGPIGPDRQPLYVDWVKYGAVTPVQDKGDCGCCWAFGCTGLVEPQNFFKTKELVKLSEQQLIDANHLRNFGCNGGSVEEALDYIIRNGGIVPEKDYPFVGVQCPAKHVKALGVTIDDWEVFQDFSERALKMLVASGPIAATVGCDDIFLKYKVGKVIDGPNYTVRQMREYGIIHSVVIVGYGETLFGEKFWLVKSSHGGELMMIARENGKKGGAFGIARHVTIVRKKSANAQVVVKTDEDMGMVARVRWESESDEDEDGCF